MAKGKRKNKKKILICVISVVIVLGLVITGLNALAVKNLLKKGNAYDAVETENKLVPQKDENG